MRILYEKKRKTTHCYPKLDVVLGWCGTCNPEAKVPGERGYCDPGDGGIPFPGDNDGRENTIVKRDANWGFCSKLCSPDIDLFPKTLQETKLTVLKDDECDIFNNDQLQFTPGVSLIP